MIAVDSLHAVALAAVKSIRSIAFEAFHFEWVV